MSRSKNEQTNVEAIQKEGNVRKSEKTTMNGNKNEKEQNFEWRVKDARMGEGRKRGREGGREKGKVNLY